MATKYEEYDAASNSQHFTWGMNWLSQSFTPAVSHIITSVKLYLNKVGAPPGIFTVSIRKSNNNLPIDLDLCSGTLVVAGLPNQPASEQKEITLGGGTLLLAESEYAILIRLPAGSDGQMVGWRRVSPGGGYADGDEAYSLDSGESWTELEDVDFLFEEWGDPLGGGMPGLSIGAMAEMAGVA